MRIIVVDDDRLVCDSLKIILGARGDIEVAGIGSTGHDAVRLYHDLRPDIALLDIQMPELDGLAAARAILADDPQARIVFLTTFADDEYIVSALRLGARGYLIKTDVATIPPALEQVMAGKRILEGRAVADVDFAAAGNAAPSAEKDPGADDARPTDVPSLRPAAFSCLTEREYEVVRLIAQGLDNRQIATEAYMGEGTVRNHISTILTKLGLRNRTQIAIAYLRG